MRLYVKNSKGLREPIRCRVRSKRLEGVMSEVANSIMPIEPPIVSSDSFWINSRSSAWMVMGSFLSFSRWVVE